MAKTRERKPEQQYIPGTAPPRIKELDEAADAYCAVRDERMELTEQEVAKKDKLLELMKKHELKVYEYDGKTVELVATDETVKVKRRKPVESDE